MRPFSVEEELLVVEAHTLAPYPVGQEIVATHEEASRFRPVPADDVVRSDWPAPPEHVLVADVHQEQLRVIGPPLNTVDEQLAAIRAGRSLADGAAKEWGARPVALAAPVFAKPPHVTTDPGHRRLGEHFGLLARQELTCGLRVHVEIESEEEGVGVLDRIRGWLPVLLAMSANSPFWCGTDSSYGSYRYQSWSRWPTSGPTEPFGTVAEYHRRADVAVLSGASLDRDTLHYDARLSALYPTVEIQLADVCLDATHAAAVASLARALVETASSHWASGQPAPGQSAGELRAWTWRAARDGLSGRLVDPATGALRPAEEVVGRFLAMVSPSLEEAEELNAVSGLVEDLLDDGTGAVWQRRAYAERGDLRDVMEAAIAFTHGDEPPPEEPGAAVMPLIA